MGATWRTRRGAGSRAHANSDDGSFLSTEEQRSEGLKHIPIGRFGNSEEMAKLALFLASDAASYVVGETLVADGGYVLL